MHVGAPFLLFDEALWELPAIQVETDDPEKLVPEVDLTSLEATLVIL